MELHERSAGRVESRLCRLVRFVEFVLDVLDESSCGMSCVSLCKCIVVKSLEEMCSFEVVKMRDCLMLVLNL